MNKNSFSEPISDLSKDQYKPNVKNFIYDLTKKDSIFIIFLVSRGKFGGDHISL